MNLTQKYLFKTFGCKANFHDSHLIEDYLKAQGWKRTDDETDFDLCVVNGCAVTNEADRQSQKMAEKMRRRCPGGRVVLTGCGVEVQPEKFQDSADWIVSNRDKPRLVQLVEAAMDQDRFGVLGQAKGYEVIQSEHPMDREWPNLEEEPERNWSSDAEARSRTRVFLKVQEGCNSFCTFCIIPYGRGPARSLRPKRILENIQRLVNEGVREVVLTGTNLGDFGIEWNPDQPRGSGFSSLVGQILRETDLPRLRLSSLDPVEINEDLLELIRMQPRLCPHLHVSLQSPVSRVLRLMKRKYRAEDVEHCLKQIASIDRDVFVGMDLITGFPGETEADFQESLERLDRYSWSRLHAFPYSERDGTPATRLPGSVPLGERKKRRQELNRLSLNKLQDYHQRVLEKSTGQIDEVLFESRASLREISGSGDWILGHSPQYLRVAIPAGGVIQSNSIRSVQADRLETLTDRGEILIIAQGAV